jgi:hypothetical protein
MTLEPLRPLSAGNLVGVERQTIVDIVGEMVNVNFDRDVMLARRGDWVKLLADAFAAPEGWPRLWLEVRRWVYWTQEVGYWLSYVFERGCRAHAPGMRGMGLTLIAQAEETVGDDADAQATLEHAYMWAQASWPDADSRPPHINDFLTQVASRLRIYDWYYRDTARPGSIDRHNPLLFTPYHLRTWASLRQTFGCLRSNTWETSNVGELSAVVNSCIGRDYDYFRPIARRFLAARLSDDHQARAAAEQLQLALDDAQSYGDQEPAIYVRPLDGMFGVSYEIQVNLNAEIGHLLRLQAETLGALGRWDDAERAAQAATENEAFYQSSYWKALSAKGLGHIKLLRQDTTGALAAFTEGRHAFDRHMMLTKIPASRSAKQQVIRRYVEGAVVVADLAGQTEALVAEIESAAPVGPAEELGELLVALHDESATDMQALRATFYEHLTSIPEDFDDYLRDLPAEREQRYEFRALWERNKRYVEATTLACFSDFAAAQLCRTTRPDTTAVLHHSGRSGTLFAAVELDGTGKSHLVQAPWGELELFELHRRYRDEMAAATSPEGRSAAVRRLMQGADELLSPTMTELLPFMRGRHIKFFPRAQLAAIPLHAISVEGVPLINHCDVSYGTTVRQVTFPREVFGALPPGNRITA